MTKLEFFQKFQQNRFYFENLTKIEIFRKIDQNQNFPKILPLSKFFENFTKIEILAEFVIFRKFWAKIEILENLIKIEILTKI